jgi:hypothetical protein
MVKLSVRSRLAASEECGVGLHGGIEQCLRLAAFPASWLGGRAGTERYKAGLGKLRLPIQPDT